jgi:hypothetical protein
MFDGGDHEGARLSRPRDALEREIVALGGATREDDLAWIPRPDHLRDLLARELDGGLCTPACVVLAALPNSSRKYGSIASSTRGSTGVVA